MAPIAGASGGSPNGGGFTPPPGGFGSSSGGGGFTPPAGGRGAPGAPHGYPLAGQGGYFGPALADAATTPGAPYGIEPLTGLPYSDKQKLVGGLLQVFLPGVGRLYLGHIGIGVAQLVTWFFCVGFIWGVIDGVLILAGKVTDPQGRPLRD